MHSGMISSVVRMEEERVCDTLQGAGEDCTGARTLGMSEGITQSGERRPAPCGECTELVRTWEQWNVQSKAVRAGEGAHPG